MKNILGICLLFILTIMSQMRGQTVVQQDTLSGNPLTLSMDSRISKVIDAAEANCSKANAVAEDSFKTDHPTKVAVPTKPMTTAEICRQNPKIMGYKIQLAVVKSNEEARKIGLEFRSQFPSMKVEIDASLRPNYKVMAGSYFKKEGADSDIKKIKGAFPDARAIPYRIFCVEAK